MKQLIFILIIIIIAFSCKKKEDDIEYHDLSGEIIYSDSFMPAIWESPFNRRKISETDKDIGQFIKADAVDPRLRKIIGLMENFIKLIKEKNLAEIEKNLTPSAFNSFKLRYNEININEAFFLRVAYPEFMVKNDITPKRQESDVDRELKDQGKLLNTGKEKNVSPENGITDPKKQVNKTVSPINENKFWINFKLVFPSASIKSSIELENLNDKYLISDFDNQFFEDLKNISSLNKKKK